MAFVKDEPAKAASLVANIQKLTDANKSKGLKSFVVFTSGGQELKAPLEKLAAEKKITLPMTFLPRGTNSADYGAYKINPEANNTVLVYNAHKVYANFVNVDDKAFENVAKAASDMLAAK